MSNTSFKIARRPLGRSGIEVSEIGFGALEIGRDWAPDVNPGDGHRHLSQGDATRVVLGLLDMGVNLFDTAAAYGRSEEWIGAALAGAPGRRDEMVLATKCGERWSPEGGSLYDYSKSATLASIDESLRKLRTDRIDLLQIHSASMEVLEKGDTLEGMREAQRAGKVRLVGISGGVEECVRAVELGYDSVQVAYNLLNQEAEQRLLPLAAEKGVAVLVMRPLAGGKLTDAKRGKIEDVGLRDGVAGFERVAREAGAAGLDVEGFRDRLAGLSLAYLLAAKPGITSLLVGTRRLEAVEANARDAALAAPAMTQGVREALRAYAAGLSVKTW